MKLTLTQMRIGILLLNVLITVLIATQAAYGVFSQPRTAVKPAPTLDPGKLTYLHGKVGVQGPSLVAMARDISRGIIPAPPPLAPAPSDAPKGEGAADAGPRDPDDLPPGPLEAGWKLESIIVHAENPKANFAVLKKKDAVSAVGIGGSKKKAPPKVIGGSTRKLPTPRLPGGGVQLPTDSKTVRQWGKDRRWVDEEAKIDVYVIEIARDQLKYEDMNQPGRLFALRKEGSSIYADGPGGQRALKKSEEPADPGAPPEKEEVHFFPVPPDYDKEFEERKARAPSAARPGSKPALPNAAHPANQPGTRPPAAEDLRKLGETLKELETNKDFQRTPKEQREKIQQLLKGAGKK